MDLEKPFKVVIPAMSKFDTTEILGKPMLYHVYKRAVESGAEDVIVASSKKEILELVESFGGIATYVAPDHITGTDMIAEVAMARGFEDDEIIVNLHSDEPLMPPALIRKIAEDLHEHATLQITTLCEPIINPKDLLDTNSVKVVLNHRGFALYFSRAAIPWDIESYSYEKDGISQVSPHHYKHIGIYAYRCSFLQQYLEWGRSPIGQMEGLEQLRVLWNGHKMHCSVSAQPLPIDIKKKSDLKIAEEYLANHHVSSLTEAKDDVNDFDLDDIDIVDTDDSIG